MEIPTNFQPDFCVTKGLDLCRFVFLRLSSQVANLQDANSNRLAWKCPSPLTHLTNQDTRLQICGKYHQNSGDFYVANDVEEEFQ